MCISPMKGVGDSAARAGCGQRQTGVMKEAQGPRRATGGGGRQEGCPPEPPNGEWSCPHLLLDSGLLSCGRTHFCYWKPPAYGPGSHVLEANCDSQQRKMGRQSWAAQGSTWQLPPRGASGSGPRQLPAVSPCQLERTGFFAQKEEG